MKKLLAYILIASCLMSLAGCSETQSGGNWVAFYYPRTEIVYGISDGVISSEKRQIAEENSSVESILMQYLSGPETGEFRSPFPEFCRIISISQQQDGITVTLSDDFAELTGMELSVACSCLALTVTAVTGQDCVTIQTQTHTLDGRAAVTVISSALNLTDNYIAPAQP